MFRQHPLRFYIANAFLNLNTLKKNKHAEKKEPAPATPDAAPDVAPDVAPEVMLGGSDPAVEQQLCLSVSTTGTKTATFEVKKTSECGAPGFISDCSITDLSHGDPYNLIDYDSDRGSYALNCYTNVATSLHTVDTTSADWQSINLGNNAFVYYNKDGWFVDQWTKQLVEFSTSNSPPSVLTPSSYNGDLEAFSTTDNYIFPTAAYQNIPFYAYTTKGEGYSSFYMTLTLPSGPNPPQIETPILSIFRSDGTVTTYNNPKADQKITFSDASPALTMEITMMQEDPYYAITYKFT